MPLKNENDWDPSPQCSEDGNFEWFYSDSTHASIKKFWADTVGDGMEIP